MVIACLVDVFSFSLFFSLFFPFFFPFLDALCWLSALNLNHLLSYLSIPVQVIVDEGAKEHKITSRYVG